MISVMNSGLKRSFRAHSDQRRTMEMIEIRVLTYSMESHSMKKVLSMEHFSIYKGAKVTRSSRSYALPLFNPVPELSGPELASKSKDLKFCSSPKISQEFHQFRARIGRYLLDRSSFCTPYFRVFLQNLRAHCTNF